VQLGVVKNLKIRRKLLHLKKSHSMSTIQSMSPWVGNFKIDMDSTSVSKKKSPFWSILQLTDDNFLAKHGMGQVCKMASKNIKT
jgi:hypothetical protein